MSLRQCRQHRWWRDVMHCIASNLAEVNPDLNHVDQESACFAYTLWGLAITDILSEPPCCDSVRDWLVQLSGSLTVDRVARILKSVAELCRGYCPGTPWSDAMCTVRSFKRSVPYPMEEVDLVLSPVKKILDQYLREHDVLSLQSLLTFSEFWCRIPIGGPHLSEQCSKEYLSFESNYPEFIPDVLSEKLRDIIRNEISSVRFETVGRHSGGATSEVKRHTGLIEKERALLIPPHSRAARAAYLCGESFPTSSGVLSSRWVSVAKNVLKRRSIAAEPTVLQYMQQAVLRGLAPVMRSSRFQIYLEDQERNRVLAQEGSATLKFGTIDLSNASDSVSYALVKYLFGGTWVGNLILYTRTAQMDIDGHSISLKKFASMGSACCFPIESIIFKSIVLLAEDALGRTFRSEVYGDDIVCHEEVFYEVVRLLEHFHFTVNTSKTFPPWHPFKESCGGEYLHGIPLQICRLSRNFPGSPKPFWFRKGGGHPERVDGFISMLNQLLDLGFSHCRKFALHELMSIKNHGIPFGIPGTPNCIHTLGEVLNDHLTKDVSASIDLFEDVRFRMSFSVVEDRPSVDDDLAVIAWLRAAESSRRDGVIWPDDSVKPLLYPYRLESKIKAVPVWQFMSCSDGVGGEELSG